MSNAYGNIPYEIPDGAVQLYQAGLSCKDVAEMYQVSPSTARRWMVAKGVIRTEDKGKGRPRQDFCHRNHDQDIHRKKNGRTTYCGECKRMRDRGEV